MLKALKTVKIIVKNMLKNNGYPAAYFIKILEKFNSQFNKDKDDIDTQRELIGSLGIPYEVEHPTSLEKRLVT